MTLAQPAPPLAAVPPRAQLVTPPETEPRPADALAAEGSAITLLGGRVVELRYSFGSLRQLEAHFGSLTGLQRTLDTSGSGKPCAAHKDNRDDDGDAAPDADCGDCVQQGAIFTELAEAIAPGLLHEAVTHPDTGARVRLGKDVELCAEQLDPGKLGAYMRAFAHAFSEAMANLGNAGAAGAAETQTSSPGSSGITPPPSYSVAPMPPSGP